MQSIKSLNNDNMHANDYEQYFSTGVNINELKKSQNVNANSMVVTDHTVN